MLLFMFMQMRSMNEFSIVNVFFTNSHSRFDHICRAHCGPYSSDQGSYTDGQVLFIEQRALPRDEIVLRAPPLVPMVSSSGGMLILDGLCDGRRAEECKCVSFGTEQLGV